jgi:hypothetical protein
VFNSVSVAFMQIKFYSAEGDSGDQVEEDSEEFSWNGSLIEEAMCGFKLLYIIR